MGKTRDIKQKEKSNSSFREYMDKRREDGEKVQKVLITKVNQMREDYYKNNNFEDASQYLSNSYQEFQNTDSWSLDRISKMIENITKVLVVKDSDTKDVKQASDETKRQVSQSALALAANQQYIVATVFESISGILDTFKVVSEAKRTETVKDFPIMAGMHLFLGISNETYKSNTFFKDQYINQMNIVYQAYFSPKEAVREGQLNSAEMYMNRLVTLRKKMETLDSELINGDPLSKETQRLFKTYKFYDKQWKAVQKQLENINAARDKVRAQLLPSNLGDKPLLQASQQTITPQLMHSVGSWPLLEQKLERNPQ